MKNFIILLLFLQAICSCQKQDKWLDVKSNRSDVVPTSLEDYQALLDNDRVLNETAPTLGFMSSDNYYVTDEVWLAAQPYERNTYTWSKDIYEGTLSFDWIYAYQQIGIANIVLDGLEKFETSAPGYDNLIGSALFFRARAFYNLVQEFSKPYNEINADNDLGVVLKLTSQVQENITRSSIRRTYQQIISDLEQAEKTLPITPLYRTRPSRPAALALMSNVYLGMGNYTAALKYADLALTYNNTLLDYNTRSITATLPFPNYQSGNPEIIFFNTQTSAYFTTVSRMLIKQEFYNSYEANDLRKILFFNTLNATGIRFKGYYTGQNSAHFNGHATNELYLVAAECLARLGNKEDALTQLNKLLIKRYKAGTFTPVVAGSAYEALSKILIERNKELPFTGITRWIDLRRLNSDARFAITLQRTVNGVTYNLPPNSARYVLPLPDDEIRINKLQQNER